MNEYRVLIRQVEYRHVFVDAADEAEATSLVESGDWGDSSFVGSDGGIEVIEIDDRGVV